MQGIAHLIRLAGLAALAATAGCGPDTDSRSNAPLAGAADCPEGAVLPATAAPAVGLWAERGAAQVRVTARIGHAQPSGSAFGALWHHVETLESLPGRQPLRVTRDSATVRLELLPPYANDPTPPDPAPIHRREPHPTAAYVAPEGVVLASYESCALANPEPLVRYFRRDGRGQVVTDVMLHRLSVAP